jgi:hypothetical protein
VVDRARRLTRGGERTEEGAIASHVDQEARDPVPGGQPARDLAARARSRGARDPPGAEAERASRSFDFVTRWAVEPLDLLRELTELKPTVVHFSGHGGGRGSEAPGPADARDVVGVRRGGLRARQGGLPRELLRRRRRAHHVGRPFTLPSGDALRQVPVGCTSGFYVSSRSRAAQQRAACERQGARGALSCTMPNGGRFALARDRSQRMIEHDARTFTVFTVTGGDLQVTPMTVDDGGHLHAFYLSDPRSRSRHGASGWASTAHPGARTSDLGKLQHGAS